MSAQRSRGGSTVRSDLLAAGFDLFYARGYAATGVAEIATAAGMPKGSFYNHFAGKQDLAIAAIQLYAAQSPIAELFDESERPLVRVRTHFDVLAQRFTDSQLSRGCMMGNFANEVADQSTEVRDVLNTQFAAWVEVIATVLTEAKNAGELADDADTAILASFIVSAWEGTLTRARAAKSNEPVRAFFDTVFTRLLAA